MDPELKEQIIRECREKCSCQCYKRRRSSQQNQSECEDDDKCDDERTFIGFFTETISVIAFLFFGSVVFWLAVGGILFDLLKRLYYTDRYVKLFIAGLFTILLLSMSIRLFLNKRSCRAQILREQAEVNNKKVPPAESPKPPPEYLKVSLQDKKLQKQYSGADKEKDKMISKKFTLTIADEKKKEVFKTTKSFFIPEMAMEMKKPPVLIVYLKELILENY